MTKHAPLPVEFVTLVCDRMEAFLDEHADDPKAAIRDPDKRFLTALCAAHGFTVKQLVSEMQRVRNERECDRSPVEDRFFRIGRTLKELLL